MAQYDHLQLLRLPERFERRRQGGGRAPVRGDPDGHSRRLGDELDQAVQTQQRRRQPEFVDPSLILRVQMTGALLEDDWNQLGLTVLSSDDDRTLVLFSNTEDMTAFRERLEAFARGTQPGRQAPAYAAFIGGIEAIGSVEPRDRLGIRTSEAGFTAPEDFQTGQSYTVDIELYLPSCRSLCWRLGRRDRCPRVRSSRRDRPRSRSAIVRTAPAADSSIVLSQTIPIGAVWLWQAALLALQAASGLAW